MSRSTGCSKKLQIELPELGQIHALYGMELQSPACAASSYPLPEDDTQRDSDGRRDLDADWRHHWNGANHLSADKGHDDCKLIKRLWDQFQIKPIIAVRDSWQDADGEDAGVLTKLVLRQQNVIYTCDGRVFLRVPAQR